MEQINYLLIMLSALLAIGSPGPATLAIAGTSMSQGRRAGLALAVGVLTGSFIWSTTAAFGMAAILHTNVWLFEVLRYCGALYLLYLAFKSCRSALQKSPLHLVKGDTLSLKRNYLKGLFIHLTNPKAVFFFAALYSVGVPANTEPMALLSVIFTVGCLSCFIFLGYALIFSNPLARRLYVKSKIVFESLFSLFFGSAGIKLLLNDLGK